MDFLLEVTRKQLCCSRSCSSYCDGSFHGSCSSLYDCSAVTEWIILIQNACHLVHKLPSLLQISFTLVHTLSGLNFISEFFYDILKYDAPIGTLLLASREAGRQEGAITAWIIPLLIRARNNTWVIYASKKGIKTNPENGN